VKLAVLAVVFGLLAACTAAPAAGPTTVAPAAAPKPGATLGAAAAKPADFPTKTVTIIIPYTPGGGFDALARHLAPVLQQEIGQTVIIKNDPGGGTRIGARDFEQAGADGYTLMYMGDAALLTSTLVDPPQGFDVSKWVWICLVRTADSALVVGKSSPIQTVDDLKNAATSGLRLKMPSNGIGGFLPLHAAFAQAMGVNVTHVGGFQGSADMVPSVVRGDTDMMVATPISSEDQYLKSGDLKPVLVLSDHRSSLIPDIPTATELGLSNAATLATIGTALYGIAAPPGTPQDRVNYLQSQILTALKDQTFVEWAQSAGLGSDLSPEPAAQMLPDKQKEYATWKQFAPVLQAAASQP
jgi:tripartite-type tricarboxylate transporter receptor subunit TctC